MTSGATASGTCKGIMAPNYRLKMGKEMGSMTKATPCIVCCGKSNICQVHHIHLSTAWYNRQMSSLGISHPMCHFCDTSHAVDSRTRQNVILTDSTLSGIQYLQGWGWEDKDPLHCDVEAVPGGKIVTLKRAWERAYHRNPLPIDTVLVAGLNDIRDTARLYMGRYTLEETANKASEDIMTSIKGLHRIVLEHSATHNVKSTLAVATVLHVPALYWHKDDGAPPSPDYTNYKDLIDTLNLKIEAFNIENGVSSAPKLHQTGERPLNRGKKRTYQFQAFRENDRANMMHLKDHKRQKMVKCLVKYFSKATEKSVQHLD